jgi:hypothetical protein
MCIKLDIEIDIMMHGQRNIKIEGVVLSIFMTMEKVLLHATDVTHKCRTFCIVNIAELD